MALSIGIRNSISLLSAIQATRPLTFTLVGLSPTEHTSFSWTRSRTTGFPQYGFKAGISDGPSCRSRVLRVVRFASTLRGRRCRYRRILVQSRGARCANPPPFKRLLPLYPRDPRSGPGYVVPVHHHLTGPMRPTPRPSPISPHGGLYALSSLCVIARRLGDPGADPCFCWHTFSTCRPPRPREVHRLLSPSSFTDDAGLRPECRWSRHFQDPPPPILVGGEFSRLHYGSLSLRPADLLALLVGADQVLTQPTRTFTFGLPAD